VRGLGPVLVVVRVAVRDLLEAWTGLGIGLGLGGGRHRIRVRVRVRVGVRVRVRDRDRAKGRLLSTCGGRSRLS
jgi:hypothetical protein